MTQPVQEPTTDRYGQALGFGNRQLFRRPAPVGVGGNFEIKVVADDEVVTTGDGQFIFAIPADLNGTDLVVAQAFVTTVATGATKVTVQIRNVTSGLDMLSTKITIDASEFTSYTASVPPVINTANDNVATADLIAVDVDAVGSTLPGQGLGVILRFA